MIGYPVKNNLKTLVMSGFQEMIKIGERPELRVHIAIVLDGVI